MGCAQLIHGRFTRALVGEQAPAPVLAWLSDRTRRATMARPTASISSARKWKSYSAETSAGAGRPPDLCDFYNRRRRHEPADFTAERLAAARGTEALGSRLPYLVPTHDRGPRPLRRRSTWLLPIAQGESSPAPRPNERIATNWSDRVTRPGRMLPRGSSGRGRPPPATLALLLCRSTSRKATWPLPRWAARKQHGRQRPTQRRCGSDRQHRQRCCLCSWLSDKPPKSTPRRVVGGISEISAQIRLLSHQTGVSLVRGMVVSHDQSIHLRLEWFSRQPRSQAAALTRSPGSLRNAWRCGARAGASRCSAVRPSR